MKTPQASSTKTTRQTARAEALRANLARRKEQARERASADSSQPDSTFAPSPATPE